ncbi:MAG: tetratricopeptide repeat protein [Candidatus Latescibacteria bacterium]|nr:tetratricopeptide repeat protein [Candidatus Latescibacterota bacterium]
MAESLLPLEDRPRTWYLYGLLLCLIGALIFGNLYTHLLDTHDAETFQDHLRIQQDWHYFFSPDKAQASGRPFAEAVKYLAFLAWGNHPGVFHLLVVAAHVLASLLWAWACRRLGLNLGLSLLTGLLFLVNVTHFQVVHHISALDYPLALCWMLVSLGCYAHACRSGSAWWWAGFGGGMVLGLMTHLSSGVVVLFCLYWSRREGEGLGQVGRRLLGLGLGLVPVLLLLLHLTSSQTSTWRSLELYRAQDLATLLVGMVRVLLWFVSRLWTTAHWLPLPVYRQESWELYAGGAALCGLGWLLWRRHWPLALGAAWMLCALLPFLLLTETTIRDLPAGPSRYLYLASAGSSLVWAWGLQEAGQLRRWGRPLFLAGLAVLLVSSYVSLQRTEAISLYTSGRNYLAHGQTEEGAAQLRRALRCAPEEIPLEEVYFRLASVLPYMGEDPTSLLQGALAEFPDSFLLNTAMAVISTESLDAETRNYSQGVLEQLHRQAEQKGQGQIFAINVSAIYNNLGNGYLRKGEVLGAIQAFQRALAFKPDKAPAILGLGQAYTLRGLQLGEEGQVEQAAQAYDQALALNPADAIALVNLGWLHYSAGRWDEAIVHYQAALASGPNAHAQFNLGLAYLARGDAEAARSAYAQAIARFGAAAGEQIGAARDLQALISRGDTVGTARQILGTYWPAR